MKKIKRALISLSNKNNLKKILSTLSKHKIKLISSGGTFKQIKKLKFNCTEISKYTGSPEILEGRVKTLHPKIYGGILCKRKNKSHKKDLLKNNFPEIDLVIVNFYPFEKNLNQTNNHFKIIENIDIGNEGWKFSAQGYTVDVETGLYFGKKNSFTENKNLFISGITQKEDQLIKWKFEKI